MKHVVKMQTIDLIVTRRVDVFALQQRFSEAYHNRILPVIEAFFDEVSNDEETIVLDKLEIDLGFLKEHQVAANVSDDYIERAVLDRLRDAFGNSVHNQGRSACKISNVVAAFDQWLFYMAKGYLPWSLSRLFGNWKEKVLEALSTDYHSVSKLRDTVVSNPSSLSRLISQHDDTFLMNLLEVITARSQKRLIYFLQDLTTPNELKLVDTHFRRKLWHFLLMRSCVHASDAITDDVTVVLLQKLIDSGCMQDVKSFKKYFPRLAGSRDDVFDALFTRKIQLEKGLNSDHQTNNPKTKANEQDLSREMLDVLSSYATSTVAEISPVISEPSETGTKDDVFLENAGAVLLHPFLNILFTVVGLVENGVFVNEDAQEKAVYLIHFLVTGRLCADEYELVAPKVLCSYPLSKPVSAHVTLSETEIEEGEHLLREVISKWEILKNTSVEGLRDGFLRRRGKLSRRNDKMQLHIETGPIDMLLDHLPWNIGVIKLPWMKDFIFVEWR